MLNTHLWILWWSLPNCAVGWFWWTVLFGLEIFHWQPFKLMFFLKDSHSAVFLFRQSPSGFILCYTSFWKQGRVSHPFLVTRIRWRTQEQHSSRAVHISVLWDSKHPVLTSAPTSAFYHCVQLLVILSPPLSQTSALPYTGIAVVFSFQRGLFPLFHQSLFSTSFQLAFINFNAFIKFFLWVLPFWFVLF